MTQTALTLLPPPDNACSLCGVEHESGEPHDGQSIYYQMNFFHEHGRWPTWADALAHCEPNTQNAWKAKLRERGVPEAQL